MMHYGFKILITLFLFTALSGCSSVPIFSKKGPLHTVAFYNTDRLYDTQADPEGHDKNFLPNGPLNWDQQRYEAKLNALASTIATMGGKGGPAIIGLSDLENRKVLDDLLTTGALRKSKYKVVYQDSPSEAGLDLALLYKPGTFKLASQRSIPISINERNFKARDILEVKGELHGELVTIFVNHWPSGTESRKKAAAATLHKEIIALQKNNPDAKILAIGDFDEIPSSSILRQTLKATGRPDPAYKDELFNTFYMHHVQRMGTYSGKNGFVVLDQILISKSWMAPDQKLQFVRGSALIHNPSTLKNLFGKYRNTPRPTYSGANYFGGTSDHFPVYIKVQKVK